jgi:chromate reductase
MPRSAQHRLLRVLAISGSLRESSSSTSLLRAAKRLAPNGVEIELYGHLGDLPHFNPDVEEAGAPDVVRDFQARLHAADGLIIATPEYAHGVPGTLKNALDWVVGAGELVGKPVALFNASPPSQYALASLSETLNTMSWRVVMTVPFALRGKKLDAEGIAADPEVGPAVREAVARFVEAIDSRLS